MNTYRLYNKDGEYLKEIQTDTYKEAYRLLNAGETDKIFIVEQDGHEVLCGKEWVDDLLNN